MIINTILKKKKKKKSLVVAGRVREVIMEVMETVLNFINDVKFKLQEG